MKKLLRVSILLDSKLRWILNSIKAVLSIALCALAFNFIAAMPASSAELLVNRSFENPIAPSNGNNFYLTLPNWAVAPGSTPPANGAINIVVPTTSYGNNPHATPVGGGGGGRQYLDLNGIGGTISQVVTLTDYGFVNMGVWYSVREGSRNLSGATVRLRNSAGVIVASASVVFTTADSVQTWKNASVSNIALPPGNYTMEIVMDNFHNVDLASLDFVPAVYSLEIDKSANRTGPLVVGDVVTYTYLVKNNGTWALSNVNVADVHGGTGVLPVPGSEALVTDAAPIGDTADPAIATPSAANGNWNTLGPGDTVRFTATYTLTQADVDSLQ